VQEVVSSNLTSPTIFYLVQMANSRWKIRRETLWPFLLAGTITWCSGFPAAVPAVRWFEVDKLGHFAAYGALATAIIRHPALLRWRWLGLWWALPLASAYGMGDEFRQSLTHGIRSPDWHDWLADTIGAIVAVSLYIRWPWYRQLMEMPLWRKRTKPRVEISSEPRPNLPA
jgi:VanZ family protein